MKKTVLLTVFFLLSFITYGQWSVDVEAGLSFQTYNKISVPNKDGTLFDFKKDFEIQAPRLSTRLRLGYSFAEKNHLIALFAPLAINYEGNAPNAIRFKESVFPEGSFIDGFYKFNSYRITYRRDVIDYINWKVAVGITAKARDARIRVSSIGASEEEVDFGFVPLIHVYAKYDIYRLAAFIEGDGLVGPQGRAFDFHTGVKIPINDNVNIKAGYRFIEGGADVSTVYNFTMLHFINVGLRVVI